MISCPIYESCKYQATGKCLSCEENDMVKNPKKNYYVFNKWEDDEEE